MSIGVNSKCAHQVRPPFRRMKHVRRSVNSCAYVRPHIKRKRQGSIESPSVVSTALMSDAVAKLGPLVVPARCNATGARLTCSSHTAALDPLSWTSFERWIRCPDPWPTSPRRAGAPAGSLTRTSRPKRCGWCSTSGRRQVPSPAALDSAIRLLDSPVVLPRGGDIVETAHGDIAKSCR